MQASVNVVRLFESVCRCLVCVVSLLWRDDVHHGETVLGRDGGRSQHTTTEAERCHSHPHHRLVTIAAVEINVLC